MPLLALFSKSKEHLTLVFDITSGSVGGALTVLKQGVPPKIIYSTRYPIASERKVTGERLTERMLRALEKTAENLSKEGFRHANFTNYASHKLHEALFVISSPWTLSKTRTIKVRFDKETAITPDFLKKIIASEEAAAAKESETSEAPAGSLEVIEQKVIHVCVNGYETSNPYVRKAKSVEVPFFITLAPKGLQHKLEEAIFRHFHPKKTGMHSLALLSYLSVRDMFHDRPDFLLVDVSAELTDVSIVKKDILRRTASYPMGANTVLRSLAKKLATSPDAAESLLKLHLDGKSEAALAKKMEEAIEVVRKDWVAAFRDALVPLRSDAMLPRSIFLLSGAGLGTFFSGILRSEHINDYDSPESDLEVVPVTGETLSKYCDCGKAGTPDAFLALQAVALSKFRDGTGEAAKKNLV